MNVRCIKGMVNPGLHPGARKPRLILAEQLAALHGDVLIARESSGIHLYMASPKCLEQDGERELTRRHLAVNAERYLGLGEFRSPTNPAGNSVKSDKSAYCMKTSTAYKVSELLAMPPLENRGYSPNGPGQVRSQEGGRNLVDDGQGNMVPNGPGTLVPLTELPPGHPAIDYLSLRQPPYNPTRLWEQFRAGFCTAELPECRVAGRFYKRLPAGFKNTPQGRLIMFCDIGGVTWGWQGRVLEKQLGPVKYLWHPYRMEWMPVSVLTGGQDVLLPEIADDPRPWDLAKYQFPVGSKRNRLLMGVDAAVRWNAARGLRDRGLCILVEGPMAGGPKRAASIGCRCKMMAVKS